MTATLLVTNALTLLFALWALNGKLQARAQCKFWHGWWLDNLTSQGKVGLQEEGL